MADGLIADFILCLLEWQTTFFFFFCLHPPVGYHILRLETEREPCGLGSMAMGRASFYCQGKGRVEKRP